uniref:Uncharacterized protein n=1 Tax=Coccolithus braarudii TaxID=221442 RepID=A0A7S0LFV1_9EUKA|mmetsp:Transcript_38375/g.81803  ORF Transcript_38375/g.81803 Transcript_38375/m.81803 type:complete len:149 (+) Transcript_38375:41-487(+)
MLSLLQLVLVLSQKGMRAEGSTHRVLLGQALGLILADERDCTLDRTWAAVSEYALDGSTSANLLLARAFRCMLQDTFQETRLRAHALLEAALAVEITHQLDCSFGNVVGCDAGDTQAGEEQRGAAELPRSICSHPARVRSVAPSCAHV